MNEKRKDKKIQKLLALLLVLLIAVLSVFNAQETGAIDKTLAATPGRYIRWRKGIPPEDGNWYRIAVIMHVDDWPNDYDYLMRGNTLRPSDYNIDDYFLWRDRDDTEKEFNLAKAIPSFDIAADVNYTLYYYNTPEARFVKYDSKNNHDSPAPMYYIRLADWDGLDGKMTDIGPVPGDMVDTDDSDRGRFMSNNPVPYAFVTSDHDSDNAEGDVVIEQFRGGGWYNSYHLGYMGGFQIFYGDGRPWGSAFYLDENTWSAADRFIMYYSDEVMIDTIADGQVIEDDEIVNITGNNYLTLAAGSTLTVKDGGILSVGSGLFNDGTIKVEKGGTLILQEDAFLMPWQTDSGNGNVICDGGDVIVQSGGKLVCEGVSGFKMSGADNNYSTVYNYGLIMATNLTLNGKARSVHNEGSIVVGWVVEPQYAQSFRDKKISPKGADISAVPGLKTKGHITYDVGSGVITGYTSPLVY